MIPIPRFPPSPFFSSLHSFFIPFPFHVFSAPFWGFVLGHCKCASVCVRGKRKEKRGEIEREGDFVTLRVWNDVFCFSLDPCRPSFDLDLDLDLDLCLCPWIARPWIGLCLCLDGDLDQICRDQKIGDDANDPCLQSLFRVPPLISGRQRSAPTLCKPSWFEKKGRESQVK